MGAKHFSVVTRGPGFELGTWRCTHTHEEPGPEQIADRPIINVVLAGTFVRHTGRQALLADPTVAILSAPGDTWRSSHPRGSRGDHGVFVQLDPDLLPRSPARVRRLTARVWADWARTRGGDVTLATALVADVIDGSALPGREPVYVVRARRWLAAERRNPPSLQVLADELGVSPWHLCRTFRAFTGATPREYTERLRLAEAATRIEAGCSDLSALAYELGFSSHSHLSARFRAAFDRTPRQTARS